jgi:hypothetical protein
MSSPLVESLGKSEHYPAPPILITFPAVKTLQRVSLVRHPDGKQKRTNGIRLRTASSSGRWKPRQEVEMRKRVSCELHIRRATVP